MSDSDDDEDEWVQGIIAAQAAQAAQAQEARSQPSQERGPAAQEAQSQERGPAAQASRPTTGKKQSKRSELLHEMFNIGVYLNAHGSLDIDEWTEVIPLPEPIKVMSVLTTELNICAVKIDEASLIRGVQQVYTPSYELGGASTNHSFATELISFIKASVPRDHLLFEKYITSSPIFATEPSLFRNRSWHFDPAKETEYIIIFWVNEKEELQIEKINLRHIDHKVVIYEDGTRMISLNKKALLTYVIGFCKKKGIPPNILFMDGSCNKRVSKSGKSQGVEYRKFQREITESGTLGGYKRKTKKKNKK